jgi:hypothetical protein
LDALNVEGVWLENTEENIVKNIGDSTDINTV